MKNMLLLMVVGVAVLCVSCRRSDMREAEIHVPDMKNGECAQIVINALRRTPGVRIDDPNKAIDLQTRRVTFQYESLHLALKNIEFAIADVGFSANGVPANKEAAAKLPAGCRGATAEGVATKNDT